MAKSNFAHLAERYEVELCQGECTRKGHEDGFIYEGKVHFRDRRMDRNNLRRFLMLVHDVNYGRRPEILTRRIEEAQYIHSRNTWAYHTALTDLGIRLTRAQSATDRARVMQLLANQGGPYVVTTLRNWAREG